MQAIRLYSQNVGMKFVIEKCSMQIMKSGKRQKTEGIELINQEKSERSEKRKLEVLANIGNGLHQTSGEERKEKIKSQENE